MCLGSISTVSCPGWQRTGKEVVTLVLEIESKEKWLNQRVREWRRKGLVFLWPKWLWRTGMSGKWLFKAACCVVCDINLPLKSPSQSQFLDKSVLSIACEIFFFFFNSKRLSFTQASCKTTLWKWKPRKNKRRLEVSRDSQRSEWGLWSFSTGYGTGVEGGSQFLWVPVS